MIIARISDFGLFVLIAWGAGALLIGHWAWTWNRNATAWFLLALVATPLTAAAALLLLGPDRRRV